VSLEKVLAENRRIAILRTLNEDQDRQLNTSIIQDFLGVIGHRCSRDRIETECAWLAEQGLVAVEQVGPVQVVTLTGRGQDVAEGMSVVPGVKRPRAGG